MPECMKPADERTRAVNSMFGNIVGKYDFLNHFLSLGIDRLWRWRLSLAATEHTTGTGVNRLFLDLAAGTLDVSLALHRRRPGADILAMDYCEPMLRHGLDKLSTPVLKNRISTIAADARRLPLPDACVDSITMAFGIRNIEPRSEAFREMFRVLKPGGRACILEFGSGKQKIALGLYNFYLSHVLPGIGKIISGDSSAYTYLARTIKAFPNGDELAAEMRDAGFGKVTHHGLSLGIVRLHIADKA